jgi:putative FmdB family regulatory protein
VPIYEYVCSACNHRTDIVHGRNENGPQFCPNCGREGTMRKAFAPPTVHFKGSGWAKKDRTASRTKAAAKSESGTSESKAGDSGSSSSSDPSKDSSGSSTGSSSESSPASSSSKSSSDPD